MAFFSEIFLSKLINQPVYTADEVFYGYFRDFAVILDKNTHNFKVTKLRVRPAKSQDRVYIPWSSVQSIETQPIVFKLKEKAEEVPIFEKEEKEEFRLKRDILDQQIIDTNHHKVVRVNDIKLVAIKDEIFMVAADIGLKGLLRRIGGEGLVRFLNQWFNIYISDTLIKSQDITPFPASLKHDIQINVARDKLAKLHPGELADIIEQLDHNEQISILQKLDMESLAETVSALQPDVRLKLLAKFKDETLSNVLETLRPDEATDIIEDLPKRRMKAVLKLMKKEDASEIEELIKFEEDAAGSLMNTEYVSFSSSMTAGEALKKLKSYADQAEVIFYLYIIDDEAKLIGAISLKNLIFADEKSFLSDLITSKVIYVKTADKIRDVVHQLLKYGLIALPVVDYKKRMKGIITIEDVLKEVNPFKKQELF